MKQLNDNIVYLKISNGHRIWIFKKPVNRFKYFGLYGKEDIQLNTQEVTKNDI